MQHSNSVAKAAYVYLAVTPDFPHVFPVHKSLHLRHRWPLRSKDRQKAHKWAVSTNATRVQKPAWRPKDIPRSSRGRCS